MAKIRKQKRGYYITDEAFLMFQEITVDEGQSPGAYLERIIRDLAEQKLSAEKRADLKQQAEQLATQAGSAN